MKNVIRVVVVMFASLCLMLTAKAGEAGLNGIVKAMPAGMAERLNNQGNALARSIQRSGEQGQPH